MEEIEEKIDELARMVARGFSELSATMATKKDLQDLVVRVDALEESHIDMRLEMRDGFRRLWADVESLMDRYIGLFRKDYDTLATRVKDLENIVLPA